VKYRFTATRTFWRSFGKLSPEQQERARKTFAIFKENPFDARLRSDKIHKFVCSLWPHHLRRGN